MLANLPDGFTALVTGASGAIGGAVIRALLADSRPARVIAVSRRPAPHTLADARLTWVEAEVASEAGRRAIAEALGDMPLHLWFNAIGILHEGETFPEKRLEELDEAALQHLYRVNAITPALLLKTLHPHLKGDHPAIVASLSARVGSIADNRLGGWYGYRASKAAHNMLMRTAAVELKRLNAQSCVLCLHPGTTDSALSRPFQARVPEGKLFTPDFVAERLLEVIGQRRAEESGSFWDWAGEPIPW
ncbi:SDR family NAD(P)-dependent oxidoreductase [Bisbaumannia pacifica]|uniref:SDR family NAD(P)-dependent oxidoreductase n=1 Tax=Bisbaumannia pacifica TaxID=77098 RepID=A0A510XCU9_9GAMM|nr:SDR family NAD(P)-dependent oxidoreductase [Halomonas pacifica]MBH8580058.1 SDR family NAD(P)-dependent oxidoreductase [Halomonas pacifica]GEK46350.1 short-chain dehydrogenase [Halomonas pacifica]